MRKGATAGQLGGVARTAKLSFARGLTWMHELALGGHVEKTSEQPLENCISADIARHGQLRALLSARCLYIGTK